MSNNYIIEIHAKALGITVEAGIVVRDGRRFRSYAATHAFNSLEGQLFKSPKAAEAAALRHIVERSMRGRFDGIDVPDKQESYATSHYVRTECHTVCQAALLQLPRSGDVPESYIAKCCGIELVEQRRRKVLFGERRRMITIISIHPPTLEHLKELWRSCSVPSLTTVGPFHGDGWES